MAHPNRQAIIDSLGGCHNRAKIIRLLDNEKPPPPPPPGNYVRVQLGSRNILSPEGRPEKFSVATWENPYEGTVTHQQIIRFMSYMQQISCNTILLKANSFMVDDSGKNFLPHRFVGMHNLVQAAEARGIYTIINLFDTWARGKGTNQITTNNHNHPINVWDKGHTKLAADYIKEMTRKFIRYPRVMFQLGNEMEWGHHGSNWQTFHWLAKNHLLIHFYNIAGRDRPIMASQRRMWTLPTNVVENHNPNNMPFTKPTDRPTFTTELAAGSFMWNPNSIANPANIPKYKAAIDRALVHGHCGCAAATGLRIRNLPRAGSPEDIVLRYLGTKF